MVDIVRVKRNHSNSSPPGAGTLPEGSLAVNSFTSEIWIGGAGDNPIIVYDPTLPPAAHTHDEYLLPAEVLGGNQLTATVNSGEVTLSTTNPLLETSVYDLHIANSDAHHDEIHALRSHDDTNIAEISTDGDVITWNGTSNRWENKAPLGGLIEYGASADPLGTGVPSGDPIETDFNNMDWTGHDHAEGTDSLYIADNHSVTCGNLTNVAYKWLGPKNVHVGGTQPGAYICVAEDFQPIGIGDHTLLTNIGTHSHVEIDGHIDDTDIHHPAASLINSGAGYLTLVEATQVFTATAVDLASEVEGNLPVTNLDGGGAAGATTFWCGDGTWKLPPYTTETDHDGWDHDLDCGTFV